MRERDDADALEVALIENMAREDLNPVEEARACAALVEELGLTREDVGLRVGRSRVAVSNLLRLLDLPDEALELLERGDADRGPRPRAAARRPTTRDRRRLARDGGRRRAGRCACSRRRPARPTRPMRRPERRAAAPRAALHPDQAGRRDEIADALGAALGVEVARPAPPAPATASSWRSTTRRGARARPPAATPRRASERRRDSALRCATVAPRAISSVG